MNILSGTLKALEDFLAQSDKNIVYVDEKVF